MKYNVVYGYKCSKDKIIQYNWFISSQLIEKVKEHLRRKTAVSDHIINCNKCINETMTGILKWWLFSLTYIRQNGILKECRNIFETWISEAILVICFNPNLNEQFIKLGNTHTLRISGSTFLYCV